MHDYDEYGDDYSDVEMTMAKLSMMTMVIMIIMTTTTP